MHLTTKKVLDTVKNSNMISPGDKILVGFSGGADSLFLFISLLELQKELDFTVFAAHLNHGIRGEEADRDENFTKDICKKYNVKLFTKKVDIPKISAEQKISEECAGRNQRYLFFNEICAKYNINKIAVAHNKNDSVETIILNLIRGSSLNGLCGIKPINENIIRPIIDITREEIENYLAEYDIKFCTDSTNASDIYTRNIIRNNILKKFSEINPSVIETIYSNAKLLCNDRDFFENYCCDLNCIRVDNGEIIINRDTFSKQHYSVKSRIIMSAFNKIKGNCNNISNKHIEIICNADKTGNIYNMPDNITVKICHDKIIFSGRTDDTASFLFDIYPGTEYTLSDKLTLSCNYVSKCDFMKKNAIYINADVLKNEYITVRNKKDGDRFVPYGMKSEKKLKQFFNDIKIPSYDRNKVPIIVNGDEIVAVVPYRISEKYKVTEKTHKILEIKLTKEENIDVNQ